MNKIIIFSMVLFLCCCKEADRSTPVIIYHLGRELYHYPDLYISLQKVHPQLSDEDLAVLKKLYKNIISEQDKQEFLKLSTKQLITDKNTLKELYKFILENDRFYSKSPNTSNNISNETEWEIVTNGKSFFLPHKFELEYFTNLKAYLKLKDCDEVVIKEFSQY